MLAVGREASGIALRALMTICHRVTERLTPCRYEDTAPLRTEITPPCPRHIPSRSSSFANPKILPARDRFV
jgi:hypothetical protein